MHLRNNDQTQAQPTVQIRVIMQDPGALGQTDTEISILANKGDSILEAALENGILLEHACGGVCACSTCHIYLKEGESSISEAEDDELDRVEEAPGLQINSRLSCQCRIEGDGPIVVEIPAWNRNAVKENPH